jgi:F0F1-type ATP synthase alpha subunit
MNDTDVKSNGHSEQAINDKLQNFLDIGTFDGAFSTHQMASAIEKFVERGEEVEDLLLRGEFRDVNHMNATIILYSLAKDFNDKVLQEILLNHVAGCPAIEGKRIDILLRAVVGQYGQERKQTIGSKFRKALGLDNENK